MSEKKFKKGDKVKLINMGNNSLGQGLTLGNIYEITSSEFLDIESEYLHFINDDGVIDGFGARFFELVEEAKSEVGLKNDSSKPDLSLIPTDALWGMAAALTYGANKYSRHNFRNGLDYSRLVAATMRHLSAWNEGESLDKETGLSHIDHALASLAMLKFMEVNKPEFDNRYKVKKDESN